MAELFDNGASGLRSLQETFLTNISPADSKDMRKDSTKMGNNLKNLTAEFQQELQFLQDGLSGQPICRRVADLPSGINSYDPA